MLIKAITLENFRQYRQRQTIEFSTDKNKNVTILIGENGIGKTTFLQSFLWCLYGDTDFSDKNYLNKSIQDEMFIGDEKSVLVELKIIHLEKEFNIRRRLVYKKYNSTDIKEKSTSQFEISVKKADGQNEFVSPSDANRIVQEILPRDLSTYFFFDNERLGKMSEEINKKEVSDTFARAVRNLLGLTAIEKTIYHLNGDNNNNSVVALYRKEYTSTTNTKLVDTQERLTNTINKKSDKDKELIEKKATISILNETIKDYDNQLLNYAATEQYAKQKIQYLNDIKQEEKNIHSTQKYFLNDFDSNIFNFLVFRLINDVGKFLKDINVKDAGIPEIRDTTINYLINVRKACLCGAHIEKDNEVFKSLIELLKHIPPQSLDKMIYDFISECHSRIIDPEEFESNLLDKFRMINNSYKYIDAKNDEINDINKKLDNIQDVEDIRTKQKRANEDKTQAITEKIQLENDIKILNDRINELNATIDDLSKKDSKNSDINLWRAYAERLYSDIKKEYEENEKDVRKNLTETINEIYKQINGNEYSIFVDDKYHIQITDTKAGKWIETSTGQTNSAILSFISGCIKMAKMQTLSSGNGLKLSEPYPLVMDALFSALDERHVEQICDIIPNITEQTIIFTIQKDWNVAQKYLANKVGKLYLFDREELYSLLIREQ